MKPSCNLDKTSMQSRCNLDETSMQSRCNLDETSMERRNCGGSIAAKERADGSRGNSVLEGVKKRHKASQSIKKD